MVFSLPKDAESENERCFLEEKTEMLQKLQKMLKRHDNRVAYLWHLCILLCALAWITSNYGGISIVLPFTIWVNLSVERRRLCIVNGIEQMRLTPDDEALM